MMIQLNPAIPLVTPRGPGYAHFLIDYSQEHHLLWVVFLDETGECWTFRNPEVRMQKNLTLTGASNGLRPTESAGLGVAAANAGPGPAHEDRAAASDR